MAFSKVGKRGQITLPREIRLEFGIEEGDKVVFYRRCGEIVLEPVKKTLLDLRGSVAVSESQDFDTIRKNVLNTHFRTGNDG